MKIATNTIPPQVQNSLQMSFHYATFKYYNPIVTFKNTLPQHRLKTKQSKPRLASIGSISRIAYTIIPQSEKIQFTNAIRFQSLRRRNWGSGDVFSAKTGIRNVFQKHLVFQILTFQLFSLPPQIQNGYIMKIRTKNMLASKSSSM